MVLTDAEHNRYLIGKMLVSLIRNIYQRGRTFIVLYNVTDLYKEQ